MIHMFLPEQREFYQLDDLWKDAKSVDPEQFGGGLTAVRACFVTLRIGDQLRGCIGRLDPDGPLICGVARNAYAAAFQDPRFDAVTEP